MKRDMELVRLILLNIEGTTDVDLASYSDEQINYHQKLLYDRGFINGVAYPVLSRWEIIDPELTWEGHDFLDDARDDRVWQEAMRQIGKNVGSVSLDVLKAVLATVATNFLTGGQR